MCVASGSGAPKDAPGNTWARTIAAANQPAPAPPLPPPESALSIADAPRNLRRPGSDLDAQRQPLNPLGLPRTPRLGL